MQVKTKNFQWHRSADFFIGLLIFGSMWGLSEALLGGILRSVEFPFRAGLLTGVGMAIMAMALAIYKKPSIAIGIGLIAASSQLISVPLLHISVMCKANSCIALLIESVCLATAASLLMNKMEKSAHFRMICGGLAAFASSVVFYPVGMNVAPCKYLLSFTLGGFLVKEGLIWAAFSGCLLPVGYIAGIKLKEGMLPSLIKKPLLYYASTLSFVLFCLGITTLAFISGI